MKSDIKISLREALALHEVSDDVYELIKRDYPNARITMSPKRGDGTLTYAPTQQSDKAFAKPTGLWYAIGTEWIDWVRSEMPDWEGENAFALSIDESKILKLSNLQDLQQFENLYGDGERFTQIRWDMVAAKYGGIEISPYIYEARMNMMWYYGWDVASGCLWGDNVVTDINPIGG